MQVNLTTFKEYILMRRDAFEHKYGLVELNNRPLARRHYPNNLKYLDDMSQVMIRTLNNHPVPLRDKLLTVLIYRLVGDNTIVRRYSNKKEVFELQDLHKLAKYLNRETTIVENKYHTPLTRTGITGLARGEFLLAVACDFLDKLPKDNFYRWKTSEIARHFYEFEKVYGIKYATAYQLASDFSYINELEVRIDFIPCVPDSARDMYKQITGRSYSTKAYKEFTQVIMDWYVEQRFLDNKERLVLPHDVTQMLIGYRYFTFNQKGVLTRLREDSKVKRRINGLVIARSMYDYYKKEVDSEKD